MPQQASIDSLVDLKKATIDEWKNKIFIENNLTVDVLRLDKIHTVISGNKWFKLKNYLRQAPDKNLKGIISAGGPWSNHLSALAYACKELGLSSVGAIRGERPASYSSTLKDLQSWGMSLEFIPRELFKDEARLSEELLKRYPGYLWIPVGGEGLAGIEGVKDIKSIVELSSYSHLTTAVGTGTFLTGLLQLANADQQLLGISSLKASPESRMIEKTVETYSKKTNYQIIYDYHFGGFGKSNPELIFYMNRLFKETGIPTDFIYTAKLFYAVEDLATKGFFPPRSRILVIHSGGLQGNRSLPVKSLFF